MFNITREVGAELLVTSLGLSALPLSNQYLSWKEVGLIVCTVSSTGTCNSITIGTNKASNWGSDAVSMEICGSWCCYSSSCFDPFD